MEKTPLPGTCLWGVPKEKPAGLGRGVFVKKFSKIFSHSLLLEGIPSREGGAKTAAAVLVNGQEIPQIPMEEQKGQGLCPHRPWFFLV